MRVWLQQRQDDRRAARWLWVSILLHLPLTPLGQLFGLAALMARCSQPPAPVEELKGIPVELLEDAPPEPYVKPTVEVPTVPATMPEAVVTLPKTPKRRHHGDDALDAGGPPLADSGTESQPVTNLDASAPIARLEDAGADAGTAVAQAPNAAQALSAATHGIADSNANIQLQIYMSRVRQQPLGRELGRILKSVYQWRDFFSAGGLDPVKDLDQIWIFGPQLRDSSQVAAFLKHNVRAPRMKGAIDALVKKAGNESAWLKGTKYPAARTYADRAKRTIVMYPSQVVAVVPPGVEEAALELPSLKWPSAKGDELVTATVKTPWRALLGTGFTLPKSIQSATITVFPEEDGGARVQAVFEDENQTAAQKNAKSIQRDIDSVTLASNWLLSGSRFAEAVQVSVDGSKIKLVLTVKRSQAERILALVEGLLTPEGRRAAHDAIKSAMSDAGSRPPQTVSPGAATGAAVASEKPHVPAPTAPNAPTPPSEPTLPVAPTALNPAASAP
jgi:hypothetical protein